MGKVQAGRIEIPIEQLKLGWVADCDIFAENQVLLRKGAAVNARMIDSLKLRGITKIQAPKSSALANPRPQEPAAAVLEDLLTSAPRVYEKHKVISAVPLQLLQDASGQIEGCFSQIEHGGAPDIEAIRPPMNRVITEFLARPDCAVKLIELEHIGKYTYIHSLNVGMLFLAVARDWFNIEKLKEIAFGAILHDLGMARVGSAIISNQGKLKESEWRIVQQHPKWSAEYLMSSGASMEAIAVAYSHHERVDGSGYPSGKKGGDLDKVAKLVAVVDVYDALTSNRPFRPRMDFARAIDIIITSAGIRFDAEIANMFIRRIGRYPAGSFVKLSTDEVAVVVRPNEKAISRPVVSRVLTADGEVLDAGEELDLFQIKDIHIKELVPMSGQAEATI